MSAPQGWYDDGSGRQRWWDGTQWTEQFADQPAAAGGAPRLPDTAPPTSAPVSADAPGPATTKKRVGVLSWVALAVTVVGAVLAWIPWVMGFGWILLFIGLVLSIVSLFLKGAKWPGIVGIALAVVAGIISGIVLLVIFFGYAAQHPDEFGGTVPSPAASAPAEASAPPATAVERPSVQEVADGFLVIMAEADAAGQYTPEEALCIAQYLIDSDVSTDSLVNVANGKDVQSDVAEGQLVAQVTSEAVTACRTTP